MTRTAWKSFAFQRPGRLILWSARAWFPRTGYGPSVFYPGDSVGRAGARGMMPCRDRYVHRDTYLLRNSQRRVWPSRNRAIMCRIHDPHQHVRKRKRRVDLMDQAFHLLRCCTDPRIPRRRNRSCRPGCNQRGLLGQDQFAQPCRLQTVDLAVMADLDRSLALKQRLAFDGPRVIASRPWRCQNRPCRLQILWRSNMAASDTWGQVHGFGSVMNPILRMPASCAAAMAWATRS